MDGMLFTKLQSVEEELAFVRDRLGYPNLHLNHDRTFYEQLKTVYPESKTESQQRITTYIQEL